MLNAAILIDFGVVVENFIESSINDFEEDACMCLELCEYENNYHMVSYWIPGIKQIVYDFIAEKYKEEGESICESILDMYSSQCHSINKLDIKVKKGFESGSYTAYLAYEALSSLLLKELQKIKEWYTIYGCTHEDFCDLESSHDIIFALENEEEFPVIKLSDISAAMLGVNTFIQPSDLYDVFAHYADNYSKKQTTSLLEYKQEPIFTPEMMIYEAVVSRGKRYSILQKDSAKIKNSEVSKLQLKLEKLSNIYLILGPFENADYLFANFIATLVRDDYYNRFSSPPQGLPLHEDCLEVEVEEDNEGPIIKVSFKIRGICKGRNEWREILVKKYKMPYTGAGILDCIINMAEDIKTALAGKEKERGKDILAIEGQYPRKNLVTHGLKLEGIPLYLAKKQATYIIKTTLRCLKKPHLASSFGKDSTLVLDLIRKVYKGITVFHTDYTEEKTIPKFYCNHCCCL